MFLPVFSALRSKSFEKSKEINSFVKKYLLSLMITFDSGIFMFFICNTGNLLSFNSFISQLIIRVLFTKLFKFTVLLINQKDLLELEIL